MYEETRERGLRRRGQAAHHARHLRALLGLLRRLLRAARQRVRTQIAEDFRRGLRAGRPDRHAHLAHGRLRPGRAHGRPARDVPVRLLHGPDVARGHPRASRSPAASPRGCRWASSSPARPFSENADPRRRATRSSGRSASTARPRERERLTRAEPTSRSSGWRSTSSSPRARRCSAAARCPSASRPTRAPAPSASGCPGTLPVVNAEAVHFGLMIGMALGLRARPALGLPPQELLLSRPAEGVPGLPVRHPARADGPAGRHPHPSGPPRGGRRQARPRRRVGPDPPAPRGRVVDFNRGGTPLVEIVTEPDLRTPDAGRRVAAAAARDAPPARRQRREHGGGVAALRRQRVDPPRGRDELGTKAELKNMNSFRFLERGIEAEIARQEAPARGRRRVVQETLHFDPRTGAITSLRSKEEAHDYRYFPEPDLVPRGAHGEMLARARGACPSCRRSRRRAPGGRAGPDRRRRRAARRVHRAGRLLRGRGRAARADPRRSPTGSRRAGGRPR